MTYFLMLVLPRHQPQKACKGSPRPARVAAAKFSSSGATPRAWGGRLCKQFLRVRPGGGTVDFCVNPQLQGYMSSPQTLQILGPTLSTFCTGALQGTSSALCRCGQAGFILVVVAHSLAYNSACVMFKSGGLIRDGPEDMAICVHVMTIDPYLLF